MRRVVLLAVATFPEACPWPLAQVLDAQTASEYCLRQWGMKPTVLNRRNPMDVNTLPLTHRRPPPPRCAAMGARRADVYQTRSS